jgi:RNA polymerase sigma-70 factor (ECF subfamily)
VAGAGLVISAVADRKGLVAAACAGDERAFVELTSPHRPALHVHCYRLLGSLHDADDALQETLLRAWRGIERYEPRAPVRAWLYRVATNVCLRMLERRARDRTIAVDRHLEPYPDPVAPAASEPSASVESDEAVGLAFIAAMQLLAPKQRVVLVLRDALDWSAREVAELLGDSEAVRCSALVPEWRPSIGRVRSLALIARPAPARRRWSCSASRMPGMRSISMGSWRC